MMFRYIPPIPHKCQQTVLRIASILHQHPHFPAPTYTLALRMSARDPYLLLHLNHPLHPSDSHQPMSSSSSAWQTGIFRRLPDTETKIFALIIPDSDATKPKVINLRDGSKGHALRQIRSEARVSFTVGKREDGRGECFSFCGIQRMGIGGM